MPKVLIIFNRMIIGGSSQVISTLVNELGHGFEVKLIIGAALKNEKQADFLLKQLKVPPIVIPEMGREIAAINDWRAYQKIRKIIMDFSPDIVHTHGSKPGAIGRLAAWRAGVPAIVHTYHGHVFHSYFGPFKTRIFVWIERMLAKLSTVIIALSESQLQELRDQYRIVSANKLVMISLGIDPTKFEDKEGNIAQSFRQSYSLSPDCCAIGIVGRLVPIKNHVLFINSILLLSQKSTVPIKAFVVGGGECLESLLSYCRQKEILIATPELPNPAALIVFTGWVEAVETLYPGLDVVCVTSKNEGTPISILEAYAAGKPVVSVNCGGIKDMMPPQQLGECLVYESDAAAFVQKLQPLVENRSKRILLGCEARAHVVANANDASFIERMRLLYRRLIKD